MNIAFAMSFFVVFLVLSNVTDCHCLYYELKISNAWKKIRDSKKMLMKMIEWILSHRSDQAIEIKKLS